MDAAKRAKATEAKTEMGLAAEGLALTQTAQLAEVGMGVLDLPCWDSLDLPRWDRVVQQQHQRQQISVPCASLHWESVRQVTVLPVKLGIILFSVVTICVISAGTMSSSSCSFSQTLFVVDHVGKNVHGSVTLRTKALS
eukprot:1494730-Rhodomonas_salina.2